MKRLLLAIIRREPLGHIKDLWDLFRGAAVVRGTPPHEYLLRLFLLLLFATSGAYAAPKSGLSVKILAQVGGGHSVQLSWTDVDSGTTGIGYFVYKAPGACGPSSVFVKLNTVASTVEILTDTAVTLGNSYCYQVTAELNGGPESVPSNQVTATVSLPAPPLVAAPVVK